MAARAELIADRGEAAEASEFFRSRAFYDAEGVTHSLRIETRSWRAAVPLLVRTVPGSELPDAISPYGYPGGEVEGVPAHTASEIDWGSVGLISIFGRERLRNAPWLASPRRRSTVVVHDPARPRRLRGRLAEQIRANRRRGWAVEAVPGPDARADERAGFLRAYEDTMRRAGAAGRYLYPPAYFQAVLAFPKSWLFLARSPSGAIGAGAIAVLSDGLLHYFLGGTADEHLPSSPFKNVAGAMVELADDLGIALNLGGGVSPGDGLETFKRGFANSELPFHAHEVICHAAEYERLSADVEETEFFPRYRAA